MEQQEHDKLGIVLGAHVRPTYLVRNQRFVAVNETDLSELLTFDILQQFLTAAGIFFLSGSLWLGIEKILEQETLVLTPLLALCAAASVFGIILLIVGLALLFMRRRKLRKIFTETEPISKERPVESV